MGIPGSANLLLAAAEAESYQIDQSLRFNSSDSTNLSRTPGSTGNRKTFTVSCWVKRAQVGATQMIWSAGPASGGNIYLYFTSTDELQLSVDTEASGIVKTTQKFRDVSAWYHIVCAVDTSQATAANRVKFFINGTAVSDFASSTYPSQNHDTHWNHTSAHRIGQRNDGTAFYINAYIAEFYNLDGTAVSDAEDFAEADDNGVWRPIETSGLTFGTNGAYLKFDPTATNGIGHDHSGNGNNWTASGFTTSGPGTDVMSDTPTTNWATFNPLVTHSGRSFSEGNLKAGSVSNAQGQSTFVVNSGKWYFESTWSQIGSAAVMAGVSNKIDEDAFDGATQTWQIHYTQTGKIETASSQQTGLATWTTDDIIGTAFDCSNGNAKFYKNGAYIGQGTNSAFANTDVVFGIGAGGAAGSNTCTVNFGQREFAYPPGTASATDYFNTVTYTGNSSTQSITGVGFQPDFVWIKYRDASSAHGLFDSVRGAGKSLRSNDTTAEQTQTDSLTSFDSDGFSLGDNTESGPDVNYNTGNYVAWCWKAGGTAVSNTDGDITSSVSANQDAGFSVVTYQGNGVGGQTVGHGLGQTLSVCIVKSRGSNSWFIRHEGLDADRNLNFNSAAQIGPGGSGIIADLGSGGTGSQQYFTLQQGSNNVNNVNEDQVDYVAYCFAEKTGVNKFGSYSGTGATQFIECGFKPALVIMKSSTNAREWIMKDTARGDDKTLETHEPNSESTSETVGYQSNPNGFTLVGNSVVNTSGDTLIFMAFAENFSADTDYKALNTKNLPAPDIADGSDYFNTVLYTGTGSTNARTDVGFQPDLTWIKIRNTASNHCWYDVLRGPTKVIGSSAIDQEQTDGSVTPTSTGFTLGSENTSFGSTNGSGNTYVAWNWLAGGSGSSNTAGSITSTVSANATAGFSIVTYTGTGSIATIGHGLGVAPSVIIGKQRDTAANEWCVYHASVGNNYFFKLNTTNAKISDSTVWNNTSPTSTVFTVGTGNIANYTSAKHVAYCFAEVEGYSKFGEYTGNGSTDGTFVYCGFKPALVIVKRTDGSDTWTLWDDMRPEYNEAYYSLIPNSSAGEQSNEAADFLSNGFKLRRTPTYYNGNGNNYIFMAWASNPFGGDGVSPATAR